MTVAEIGAATGIHVRDGYSDGFVTREGEVTCVFFNKDYRSNAAGVRVNWWREGDPDENYQNVALRIPVDIQQKVSGLGDEATAYVLNNRAAIVVRRGNVVFCIYVGTPVPPAATLKGLKELAARALART